jgi:hypothetical protein
MILISLTAVMAACAGTPGNNNPGPADPEPEGFNFTQNNNANSEEQGYNFTENEAADTGNESGNSSAEEIDLEDQYIPDDSETEIPQWGIWNITHDEGSMVCADGLTMGIPAGNPETIVLELGSSDGFVFIHGFDSPERMDFVLIDKGPGGAHYLASIPVEDVVLNFDMYFLHSTDNQPYDWLEGSITSEKDGCTFYRSFYGRPAQ